MATLVAEHRQDLRLTGIPEVNDITVAVAEHINQEGPHRVAIIAGVINTRNLVLVLTVSHDHRDRIRIRHRCG